MEHKHFFNGETIILKCNCKVSFWSGPSVKSMDVSTVEISDTNGKLKVWNISIYTNKNTIHDGLPAHIFKRLNVTGDNFDLQIKNLSVSDEGLYVCDIGVKCNVSQRLYVLQHTCKLVPVP